MQLLSRLVPLKGCGGPGIGPSFHVAVDQPITSLPVEIPISQVLEPVPVVHQKSVFISPFKRSCVRLPVKHRSATEVAGAGPFQGCVEQPTCATAFENEDSTMKTENSRRGSSGLAPGATVGFRGEQENGGFFGFIMGWPHRLGI